YYIDQTNTLNKFYSPEPTSTGLNIPLLVSNGYLFFKPDIYRVSGQPGQAALNSVMAGVDYLSTLEYVDTSKMAISGHSFGGYETNYILVNSNKFKAALVGAGPSNIIQGYNETWEMGESKQDYLRNGAYVMERSLEDDKEGYIRNSPILFTDQISTPILLLHNEKDNAVPVTQSLNLFIQLRSLQKHAWLLQYKDETHALVIERNQLDFQDKVKSYFDYYLKGQIMPPWMINHINPGILSN
ncbi:hypothetical protein DBR11_05015, partial [Pedobacter sp. HMWF019]|uniref:alpha/beta hydrolase family protein n=1 Tax=Pedobacter sp. HMWF019 TaxID=2056856 RepID=UPI000D49F75F